MKLIANRQLTGAYGTVAPGDEFEAYDPVASSLLNRGLAREAKPPKIHYDTKVISPDASEVSARSPFRNMPVLDQEPERLAPESDRVLSQSKVWTSGTTHLGGRAGRAGSAPKR